MVSNILFRCWDSESNTMFYQTDDNYIQIYKENKYSLFDEKDNMIVSNVINDNNIFMQYIGWEDKDGKEIYYGDIIKYKVMWGDDDNEWGTAIVHRFLNNGAGMLRSFSKEKPFFFESKSYTSTYASWEGVIENLWYDEEMFELEVVGNIFETKHLINN